ncbi:MAG TPA: cyclic nucleotide-binding domain-containing protein [Acidimicrobiales bacterium]|nr:cyclic nucleotide-binding domain-containing protein [Acidimicrobiales bacterium]
MSTNGLTRYESVVTSLSWIPTEAIEGAQRLAFDSGITHYDVPPPTEGMDVEALRDEDRFRFANELRAFIALDSGGAIVECGYLGRGLMGSTLVNLRAVKHRFQAVQLPDLQREPERGDGWVRFVQTCGGRTGVPAPRRVRRRPFIQWQAPLVWTTLSLTLHADGRAEHALIGASRFPRHWVYGSQHTLTHKSGLTDFKDWYRKSFGKHSPWGDEDSEALVAAVESALETSLSARLMQGGGTRRIERVPAGTLLFEEGKPGTEVLLILDGIVRVERGGERLAEYGPGALLGERAHLEGGIRTSSNVAVTPCRVALFDAELIDHAELEELSAGHRREDYARD